MNYNGFKDLNFCINPNDSSFLIEHCHKYRYSTVAINHVIDLTEFHDQKKKKKGEKKDIIIPEPRAAKLPSDISGKITVLNRLTLRVSDVSQFPKVFQGKSSFLRKYDIIAVIPMEQACLQQACSMHDVDLISFDCQNKITLRLTKKIYKSALEQNKYFEICYGPALKDSATLRNTIDLSHVFYTVGKSKNLIVSSGTTDTSVLRSPYEVIYLCFLFGFGENKARTSITSIPTSLTNRALKRKQGRSCISVTSAENLLLPDPLTSLKPHAI